MSVNFNANQINRSWAGVDVQNVNKVTEQILQRAQQKTVDLTKVDLTKFNRQTQGIDLYNQNVSLETQRLIALQKAGLYNVSNNAINQLNAQAAANLYGFDTVQKLQNRVTIAVNGTEDIKKVDVYPVFGSKEVLATASSNEDKRGSDSLPYTGSSLENEDSKEGLDIQV